MAVRKNLQNNILNPYELKIMNELTDYWSKDTWNIYDCPLYTNDLKKTRTNFYFDFKITSSLKNELKYYFFSRISTKELNLPTAWNQYYELKELVNFIVNECPHVLSIMDVDNIKFKICLHTFILENGKSNITAKHTVSLFNQIYNFYNEFYDERPEIEKDIWDVRRLGIDFNKSTCSDYKLNFEFIPIQFRTLAKKYIERRLIVQENMSWGTAGQYMDKLPIFFNFIHEKYPSWTKLNDLNRNDIEDFIKYLRSTGIRGNRNGRVRSTSNSHINRMLIILETFIDHIQKFEWDEAPIKPVRILMFPEDKPKVYKNKVDQIKYIPDGIWEQIMSHIDKLPNMIIPMVLLLEATGFRISDVCALKTNCLNKKEDGWWIVGNQRKVKEVNHRVPISEEVAKVVLAQIEYSKLISDEETNPEKYLFPTVFGTRKGMPIAKENVIFNLNKLARENKITDDKGNIAKIKAHAFRHRYGVNLINNGMNILHVQKLMAHASPEMTLIYAQIHDTTLRKEWEKARENGAIRINTSGKIVATNLEQQAVENGLELEWIRHNLDSIRLDHGLCVKSPKHNCDFLEQTLEPPCIKNNCRSFHVDQTFLDYYNEQIQKMESDIEIYQQTGRTRSIELIHPKIARYKEIRDGILQNGGIFGQPKARREYVNEERNGVNINGK